MIVQPIFFMFLIVIIAVLAFFLVSIGIAYEQLHKRLHQLEKDQAKLPERSEAMLNEAHTKAIRIIAEAHEKAVKLISESKELDESTKATFQQELTQALNEQQKQLESITSSLITTYQQTASTLKDNNINMLKTVSKDIENEAVNEIKDFRQVLEQETIASQKIVEQKIEEAFKKAEADVIIYKQQRIAKVDQSIEELIKRISSQVFGRVIPLEEHKQLVLEALNQAKKEGVFS